VNNMVVNAIQGKVSGCMIGCSGVNVADRFKYFRWRERGGRVAPAYVANTITPVAWYQGHRMVECELGLLSYAGDAFSSYIVYSGDNPTISSGIVIKVADISGTIKTVVAHEPVVDSVESNIEDFAETITVYRIMAKWVDPYA